MAFMFCTCCFEGCICHSPVAHAHVTGPALGVRLGTEAPFMTLSNMDFLLELALKTSTLVLLQDGPLVEQPCDWWLATGQGWAVSAFPGHDWHDWNPLRGCTHCNR